MSPMLQAAQEGKLLEVGTQLLKMLNRCAVPAQAGRDPAATLAAREHPAAQACVLYVLRTSIINHLSEPGQVPLQTDVAFVDSFAPDPGTSTTHRLFRFCGATARSADDLCTSHYHSKSWDTETGSLHAAGPAGQFSALTPKGCGC